MIAGCAVDARLLSCLVHAYPELVLFLSVTVLGFVLVWRKWAVLLLTVVFAALLWLLERWGVPA